MKILITGPFDEIVCEELLSMGYDIIRRGPDMTSDELKKVIRDVDGYVLGGNEMLTPDLLGYAEKLKIIVFMGEQPETFMASDMKERLTKKSITLDNTLTR